jgi:hypothetical protein
LGTPADLRRAQGGITLLEVATFLAVFCNSLFAGAALYINLVEHPARMKLGTAAAVAQWAPSYHRATFMQAPLAVLSFSPPWWRGYSGPV